MSKLTMMIWPEDKDPVSDAMPSVDEFLSETVSTGVRNTRTRHSSSLSSCSSIVN